MDSDEPKTFDITSPHKVSPHATSRPVIVGHKPQMADPMVHAHVHGPGTTSHPASTPTLPADLPVATDTHSVNEHPGHDLGQSAEPPKVYHHGGFGTHIHEPELSSPSGLDGLPPLPPPTMHSSHKNRMMLWVVAMIVTLAVAAFFALNFKTPPADIPSTSNTTTPAPTTPSVPAGFSHYQVADVGISFNYPSAWGTPILIKEAGFSKRGGPNQSDGVYAYLVNFDKLPGVQVALTSSKFLPASRPTLYYDFLQWCKGSNDNKFYKQQLLFTTSNKVDTPSNIVCSTGPLTDASQLDGTTIEQLQSKNSVAKTIGDLYSKNLGVVDTPVIRVKDQTMKNADNIKKLLSGVTFDGK